MSVVKGRGQQPQPQQRQQQLWKLCFGAVTSQPSQRLTENTVFPSKNCNCSLEAVFSKFKTASTEQFQFSPTCWAPAPTDSGSHTATDCYHFNICNPPLPGCLVLRLHYMCLLISPHTQFSRKGLESLSMIHRRGRRRMEEGGLGVLSSQGLT